MYSVTHIVLNNCAAYGSLLRCTDYKPTTEQVVKTQTACLVGSVFADVPLLYKMFSNILSGHSPVHGHSHFAYVSMPIVHSFLVLGAFVLITYAFTRAWSGANRSAYWSFVGGYAGHLLVDAMTHGPGDHGHSYLWPLEKWSRFCNFRLGQIVGFWNYMPIRGFWPRKPELVVLVVTAVIWFCLWVWKRLRAPLIQLAIYRQPLAAANLEAGD